MSSPAPPWGAGVRHEKLDAERFGPLDLAPKRRPGFFQHVAARLGGQVDKIGVMRDGLGEAGFGDDGFEFLGHLGRNGRRAPLARAGGENLHGPAADGRAAGEGVVVAAGGRHMSAEQGFQQGCDGRVECFAEQRRGLRCCHR